MSLLNLFKLEKLRIEAYADAKRRPPAADSMEAMFNPTSYKRSHAVTYESPKRQALNTPGKPARYAYTPPGDVSLLLVLDGTGVGSNGPLTVPFGGRSVKKDIATFEKLCLKMNGDIHQPNFLVIRWGDFAFPGRLKTLEITYTLFDESGDPLRAELAVVFIEDKTAATVFREAGKNSPDVTHVRVVRAGDTLPLLCKEIYGSSAHYLRVARDNGLDDFRNLTPGRSLTFAPLPPGGDEPAS